MGRLMKDQTKVRQFQGLGEVCRPVRGWREASEEKSPEKGELRIDQKRHWCKGISYLVQQLPRSLKHAKFPSLFLPRPSHTLPLLGSARSDLGARQRSSGRLIPALWTQDELHKLGALIERR